MNANRLTPQTSAAPQSLPTVPVQKYDLQILMGRTVVGTAVLSLYPDKISAAAKVPLEGDELKRAVDSIAFTYEVAMNAQNNVVRTHIHALLPEVPEELQLEIPAVIG